MIEMSVPFEALSDPLFLQLPISEQYKIKQEVYQGLMKTDPLFAQLPIEERQKVLYGFPTFTKRIAENLRSGVEGLSHLAVKPPTNKPPVEDVFRTGIEDVNQPITPARSLATGPVGKGVEFGLGALSRLAPTGLTEPVIAETVGQIEEGEEGMVGRILRESGAVSPQTARSMGASVPARALDLLFSGMTVVTPQAVTQGISDFIQWAEKQSPGSGKMIERLMLVSPLIKIPGFSGAKATKATLTQVAVEEALKKMGLAPSEEASPTAPPITEAPKPTPKVSPETYQELPILQEGGKEPIVTSKRGPGIEEPTQIKPPEPEGGKPKTEKFAPWPDLSAGELVEEYIDHVLGYRDLWKRIPEGFYFDYNEHPGGSVYVTAGDSIIRFSDHNQPQGRSYGTQAPIGDFRFADIDDPKTRREVAKTISEAIKEFRKQQSRPSPSTPPSSGGEVPAPPSPPKPADISLTKEAVPAKQPWEMTYQEFYDIAGSEYTAGERFGIPTKNRLPVEKGAVAEERIHKAVVRKALSEGKPVPPEVLAEYPDLQAAKRTAKLNPEKVIQKVERGETLTPDEYSFAIDELYLSTPTRQALKIKGGVRLSEKAKLESMAGVDNEFDALQRMSREAVIFGPQEELGTGLYKGLVERGLAEERPLKKGYVEFKLTKEGNRLRQKIGSALVRGDIEPESLLRGKLLDERQLDAAKEAATAQPTINRQERITQLKAAVNEGEQHLKSGEVIAQLEKVTEKPDLSQMSLKDLTKKGFGSETGAIGKLTPEQAAREAEGRAAREEIYRRLSVEAAKTGETLEAVAERLKLPPGALAQLQAEHKQTPISETVTSIKNAKVDEELAKMGLPPATHGQWMSFEEARAAAAQKIHDDPFAGHKLVAELIGKERPVTATEDALLLHEQTRLKNERIQAEDQFIAAQKSGDQNAMAQAKARINAVTAEFMTIGDVVTKIGTESSLSLGHRRMMMKEDYSLAAMERAEQVSKGRPLTEGERAEVKALHEKINATEKSLADYIAGSQAREAEAASKIAHLELLTKATQEPTIQIEPHIRSLAERIVISMEKEAEAASARLRGKLSRLSVGVDPTIISDAAVIGAAKIARTGLEFARWSEAMVKDLGEKIKPYLQAIWEASNKKLDEQIARIAGKITEPVKRVIKKVDVTEQRAAVKDQIRAKMESGDEEDISLLAQRLARTFVEQGIKERNVLIDAVHDELKDILPNFTRRETMDAISGYGKYKQLSKDEVSVQLRDLKGQMQQVAKLEDIEAKRPPLKTGVERRVPSDEERRLIQQVNEAKRRYGVVVTDTTTQLKSALGAIKTRLRNSIADLKYQIANRTKIVRQKTSPPYDAEALELKAEQDALREEFVKIFGSPQITDAQRVRAAITVTERSIIDLENRIRVGDIGPRTRISKTPNTPELQAARARRDALKDQLQELRDLASPKKTPEQIALQSLKTRLAHNTADLLDRIARGDFTKKPKREVTLDPEAIRLRGENIKAKEQFNQRKRANELANRSRWQKGLDAFVKWERNFKLSNPIVFGKLTAAAMTRVVTTATEEVVGGVLSKLPGIRTVAVQAPREGGLNIRAMAKAFTSIFNEGMKDAWQTAKTGASHLDIVYGKQLYDPDWSNFFGQLHGMMKAPIKRGEFILSLQKRTEHAIRNGVEVTDPLVQVELGTQALGDGYRSIFMQHGFSSDMFNNFVRTLETSKMHPIAGEISARMLRFLMPIVRVPTNIVAETATGVHGVYTASARTMFHAINGTLKTLPPEVSDGIMRQFKKGSIGLGLIAIGYFNSENVGGYDWREKRKPGAVKVGGFQIGGVDIPRWMTHAPWFELMQIGGTIKHVKDQHVKGEERGIGEGLWAAAFGLIEETPFIGEMLRVDKLFGRPNQRSDFLGELGRSTVIPQAVQWAAKQMDKDAADEIIKRRPRSVLEHLKMGIPGMRQDVPKARPRGPAQESRATGFSELVGRMRRGEDISNLLRSGRISSQDLRSALEGQ